MTAKAYYLFKFCAIIPALEREKRSDCKRAKC